VSPVRAAALMAAALAGGAVMAAPGPGPRPRPGAAPTVHELMAGVIDPAADAVWQITNRNVDLLGYGDAGKYAPADWARLYAASADLRRGATIVATTKALRAAPPGVKIADEEQPGATNAAMVQARIKADPQAIRLHASNIAALAGQLQQAAVRRDAKTAQDLAGALDGACEACHLQYWYYNQEPSK
jgi:hypothetical protein